MTRPITLFSGYSQKENRVTNYCLLILRMLYEENPKYLGEVLSTLARKDISDKVGVTFRQQEKKKSSIPDGLIVQEAVTVFIETKNYDWFYDSQLENHLAALSQESSGRKILLALGKFESDDDSRFERIRKIIQKRYKSSIIFSAVSFEDFIGAVKIPTLSKNLTDAVADLESFLDEEDLMPSWERWLDVVNCAGIPEEVIDGNVYMCPATGGAYSHGRCKYFGMYRQKRVEVIALIEAIVDVELGVGETLKWKNIKAKNSDLFEKARSKVDEFRPNEGPVRVFLLGPLYQTDFQKDSPRGMQTSKMYFDISRLQEKGAEELAEKLRGMPWSALL